MDAKLIMIIAIALFVLLGFFVFVNKKGKRTMNYRAFFVIGVTWLPIGIAIQNYVLGVAGACFMVLGLANKKKWKEEPDWKDMSPEIRRKKLIIMGVLTAVLILGILLFIILR